MVRPAKLTAPRSTSTFRARHRSRLNATTTHARSLSDIPAALRSLLPLPAGARVALLAPAGPLRGREDIERAEVNARALEWEPVLVGASLARLGYLAGGDDERLAALRDALADPRVDAIWCLRGGYGAMRLLDRLDYAAWRNRPVPVIGFSDITALHHALAARAGVLGLHGPCARGELGASAQRSLRSAAGRRDSCGIAPAARVVRGGVARGPLVGGNLAVMCALVGTSFLHVPRGAILVLEDVNEPVYRIDRMLRQLQLSGVLARCAGLTFGAFTERGAGERDDDDAAATVENGSDALQRVIDESAAAVNGPVLAGVPVGHIAEQWTWPFGGMAELNADERRLTVLTD